MEAFRPVDVAPPADGLVHRGSLQGIAHEEVETGSALPARIGGAPRAGEEVVSLVVVEGVAEFHVKEGGDVPFQDVEPGVGEDGKENGIVAEVMVLDVDAGTEEEVLPELVAVRGGGLYAVGGIAAHAERVARLDHAPVTGDILEGDLPTGRAADVPAAPGGHEFPGDFLDFVHRVEEYAAVRRLDFDGLVGDLLNDHPPDDAAVFKVNDVLVGFLGRQSPGEECQCQHE